MAGIRTTEPNSQPPCRMADRRVSPPASTLADDRTMTLVSGRPPIRPDSMLPAPCAIISRFLSLTRRRGSIWSTALMQSNVSRLATSARVPATTQTCDVAHLPEVGKGEQVDEAAQTVRDRHADQMRLLQCQRRRGRHKDGVEHDARDDDDQRAGQQAHRPFARPGRVPPEQERQADGRDQHRAPQHLVADGVGDRGEGVEAVLPGRTSSLPSNAPS